MGGNGGIGQKLRVIGATIGAVLAYGVNVID
jgi:hypothetical protein